MNKGGSTDGFALDVQGLDRLRNSAHLDPQSGSSKPASSSRRCSCR